MGSPISSRLKRIRTHGLAGARQASPTPAKAGRPRQVPTHRAAPRGRAAPRCRAGLRNGARLQAAQDIVQRRMILRTPRTEPQRLIDYAGRLNLVLSRDRRGVPVRDAHGEPRQRARPHDYDLRAVMRPTPARDNPGLDRAPRVARARTSATSSPTFSLTRGSTRR